MEQELRARTSPTAEVGHQGDELPPLRQRILFWTILGAFSMVFPEVVSGAEMVPFFHPWGIVVIWPLYTLHAVVIASVVFRYGRPTFATLYLGGVIFGLYEAYLTKVLWDPPWGDPLVMVAGVGVIETAVLSFAWHPYLAFMLPLLVVETLYTSSTHVSQALPEWLRRAAGEAGTRRALLFWTAVLFGLNQSANSPSVMNSLLSGISCAAVLLALTLLWRKRDGSKASIESLLPTPGQFRVLLVLLAGLYVLMGAMLRPEALPPWTPQLVIVAIYALSFVLWRKALERSRSLAVVERTDRPDDRFPLAAFVRFALTFTVASALSEWWLGAARSFILLSGWFVCILVALWSLAHSLREIFAGRPPQTAAR